MNTLVPKNKHALIRVCKIILNIDREVTHADVDDLKLKIQQYISDGLSPSDIKNLHKIEYTDFGMFIKTCLGLKLKTFKDADNNFYRRNNRSMADEKELYHKACQFNFDPFSMKEIPGYDLLLKLGMYHPVNNQTGVCRDHMVSIEYGWRNNIDSAIISNPLNCQFISNLDNIKKGSTSSITVDNLLERISTEKYAITENKSLHLQKSELHKQKISETNSKYMTITNGNHNLRVLKTSSIPENYHRGMTRKNKMVVQPGLEPGNKIF